MNAQAKNDDQVADLEERLESAQTDLRTEIERLRQEADRAWQDGERLIDLGRESGHAARAHANGLRQQADRLERILKLVRDPSRSAPSQ